MRPGRYLFGPKAGYITSEVSCVSLYGSPGPTPLSDPVFDHTCPFDPLMNRICSSKSLITSGNGLWGQVRKAGGGRRIDAF